MAACAENAEGVRFDQTSTPSLRQGQSNLYFFRDKAFYVVQAPYIVTANVIMDGKQIGGLKNGGFTLSTVPAGRHYFAVWSGTDRTEWYSDIPADSSIYFQVWDKTRMAGARAVGGAVVGATVGAVGGAVQTAADSENQSNLRSEAKGGAVTGAVVGGIQGAVIGFRGRVREGEGRIWAVDLVGAGDALPLLKGLSASADPE